MRNNIVGIICRQIVVFILIGAGHVMAADLESNTRLTSPSGTILELGGRGGYWSVSFDRTLSESISAGLGFGTFSTQKTSTLTSRTFPVIPIYGMYYFMKDAGSVFITAGVTLVLGADSISGSTPTVGSLKVGSSPLLGHAGVGYEYRSDPGYFIRLTAYLLLGDTIAPWVGIGLGYSF